MRESTRVQLLLDGRNSNTASVARSYAERIIQAYGLKAAAGATSSSGADALPSTVDLRERAWYTAGLRSRTYNVPAVVGTLILMVCPLLSSPAVVREREIGSLEPTHALLGRGGEEWMPRTCTCS